MGWSLFTIEKWYDNLKSKEAILWKLGTLRTPRFLLKPIFSHSNPEARGVQYSESLQTSKMELFAKINNAFSCYIFLQTLHLRCSTDFWTRLWNSSKFIATHQDYWALHVPKPYQISGVLIFANSWKLILANIVTILDPWKKVHVKKVKFWKLNFTPE